MPQLERDIFAPQGGYERLLSEHLDPAPDNELTISVYQLANAFHQLMNHVKTEVFHDVVRESLSVTDYIARISRQLAQSSRISFGDLFQPGFQRAELVVTFLALLELTRMRMVNIEQVATFSEIWLTPVAAADQLQCVPLSEGLLDYD